MEEITGYPQMPPLDEAEVDELLAGPHLARLSTINPDGTPHTMPIWYEWRDGQIHVSTQANQRKVANMARDPRVTVLVDTSDFPYRGVMIYGEAELDYDDAAAKRVSILERYVGGRDRAVAAADGLAAKWDPVVAHITPTRMISFDYTKGSLPPLR
ncbi:MAG: PPOX class F420-dependent oxidoreductase [Actinomycetota bacterium]